MRFDRSISTNGDNLWSDAVKKVKTTELELDAVRDEDRMWGELLVYFDPASWNVSDLGLIYTDNGFIEELRDELNFMGFDADNVAYSEQGMQGRDYVSLDVGENFIKSWMKKDPEFKVSVLEY